MSRKIPLKAGNDPGISNFGLTWVDHKNKRALMWKVNFKSWDGEIHAIKSSDFGACVHEFCIRHAKMFNDTDALGIEYLPQAISRPGKKGVSGTNRDVYAMMCYFEQTVRIMYPHILIQLVQPVAIKAFTNTGGGKTHAQSKYLSTQSGILAPDDMENAVETFRGPGGKLQVDPIEAAEIGMYMQVNEKKLRSAHALKFEQPGVVRDFEITSFSSSIIYPEAKKAKPKKAKPSPQPRASKKLKLK